MTPSAPRGRSYQVSCLILSLLLVGLIVWNGADRVPADPSRALLVEIPPAVKSRPLGDRLRIVSFNVHSGKGDDGRVDLGRLSQIIGDCDIAGLYEVRSEWFQRDTNQAAQVAQHLQLGSVFVATERHWWREHFGNALLSRTELQAVHRIPLPGTRGKAFRNAILAHFPWRNQTLHVLAVHVDREDDRQTQLELITALFLSLEAPAILMGDLNSPVGDPALAPLLNDPEIRSPLHDALARGLPADNIDWIFTRGLTTIAAELQENDGSDHPLLRVELEIAAATPPAATRTSTP